MYATIDEPVYTRMVIGEANSEDQARELVRHFDQSLKTVWELEADTCLGFSVMIEEDGRMVVAVTHWTTRGACLKFHASGWWRRFVVATEYLLIGDFVIKMFKTAGAGDRAI